MRILITGVTGNLGSKIVEVNQDHELYGTSRVNPKTIKLISFEKADLRNKEKLEKILEKINPDCILHTASLTNVDYCENHKEETYSINVESTKNLAEFCYSKNRSLIFLSSDYVFDGKIKRKYFEEEKTNPINYYGKTKQICEDIVLNLKKGAIARIIVAYCWSSANQKMNFAHWLVKSLREGKKVKVANDQYNNAMLMENAAENLMLMAEKEITGIYSLTGKDCINRIDFAKLIAEEFNLNQDLIIPAATAELGQIAKRPFYIDSYSGKAEKKSLKLLNLKEGLKYFKENEPNAL